MLHTELTCAMERSSQIMQMLPLILFQVFFIFPFFSYSLAYIHNYHTQKQRKNKN